MKQETKQCATCKSKFVIEPDDFTFYEKIKVPPPTWCPQCRLIRRFSWRNERMLYPQTCVKCKKEIISVFSKETGLPVHCNPCWWSDGWDGTEYGIDFDPNKPFISQVHELFRRVPTMNNYTIYSTVTNSDYVNMAAHLKNCYLTTYSDFNEDSAYASFILYSKNCFDNLMISKCESCYECVNCQECYQTMFSVDCKSCMDTYFSRNCIGCSNCFGCANLRNKQYHIFNKPHSKQEYEKFFQENAPSTQNKVEEAQAKAHELWNKFPQKFMHGNRNTNVSGEYIYNSKNTLDAYIAFDMEDSRFCENVTEGKDCYDGTNYATSSELMYEFLQSGGHARNIRFCWWACSGNQDNEYSMFPIGCKNVFGCVGLKKKEYCILNKQYSKEEYKSTRKKIVEHMNANPYRDKQGNEYRYGEFFPSELSPFGYNETGAQEFFPLTENEAKQKGYNWRQPEKKEYKPTINTQGIPITIDEVKNNITEEILECEHKGTCNDNCTTAFRIIPMELLFYKRMNLPLPKLCPNCRHAARIKWRNPITLQKRTCMCAGAKSENGVYANTINHQHHGKNHCPNEFETSYSPDRPEIVYCEACYNTEVA